MQEELFCGSEGREERSDVYRDGVGRNQTAEMCEFRKLFGRETFVSAVIAARFMSSGEGQRR